MGRKKAMQFIFLISCLLLLNPGCSDSDAKISNHADIISFVPSEGSDNIVADLVVLRWPQISDACSYSVYIGKKPDKLAFVTNVNENSFNSDTLKEFTDYYWQITACREDNRKQPIYKSPVQQFKTAQKAFPSAEGFGKFTLGGRGGKVIKVTNLNDKGPGSLRAAIETSGPRIIVFEVSGNIMIKSPLQIKEPFVTIAGQTAPGDGVTVIGHETGINTNDVIIRYMRFRGTDLAGKTIDALNNGTPDDKSTRFILDHCSVSWGIDETLSACKEAICTVQWCLVSESFAHSIHKKGSHGYGGIWGGLKGSFHHNLLAHHSSRNPRFDGGFGGHKCLIDYRNNVIYNWGFNSAYGAEDDKVNMVNNYYKAGPATKKDCANRIFQAIDPNTRMFISGNFVDGFPEISEDNWAGGVHFDRKGTANEATLRVNKHFEVVDIPMTNARQAYNDVLEKVGAFLPSRDSLDRRIINEVRAGTANYGRNGEGIIDSQFDLCPQKGKCPRCIAGDYCWLPELKSEEPLKDSDDDGMPDEWEISHKLNQFDSSDGKSDRDNDGYTNIEEYINSLVNQID